MTDFIESQEIDGSYSIYNEEYSWAEEYSEYYSEDSSSYLMPVFESSSYQFFGEATFYQEASHKGLIAGGILALVSGAFFMIMKLLKGGGGGGSSSSGSSSSSSSSIRDSNGNIILTDAEKKESERLKREADESERRYEETKQRIKREREEAAARMRAEHQAMRQKEKEEREAKVAENYNKYINSEEYTSFGKDEAEITFDPADIIKDLNKVKSENPGKFKLKGGLKRLNNMQETLKDIERIVDTLNAMITDNNWEVFSHSSTENTDKMEDGDTKTFIISYRNLEDNFAKLRELIKGKQDNVEELEIDDIIAFFNSIKQITDEINKKYKSGIKKCKEKHKEHTSHKADLIRRGKSVDDVDRNIANVKSAYNILNNILKKVNEFCKELRIVFGNVCWPDNYTNALVLPFKLGTYINDGSYTFRILSDMKVADFEDVIKGLINLQRGKAGIDRTGIITELSHKISPTQSDFHLQMVEGSNGRGSTGFSEMPPYVNSKRKEILDRIREQKRIVEKIENDYPEIKDYFLKIFGIVEDFYNVPVEEWLKVKSINERQEGKKLSDLSYFINSNRFKVARKTLERYFQKNNQTHMDAAKKSNTSQVDNFIQTIQSTMGVLESAMRRDASDEFGKFKSRFEKAVNEYQNDHDEDDLMIAVHNAIEKYVYGSYSRFDNEGWSKVESWLENIGYKSINAKPGDSINPIRTYFARPISAATSDKSQDMTIKQVQLQPRVLKIKIDGKTQTHKLAGICSYYKYKDSTEVKVGGKGKDTEDPNMAKVSDKAYPEKPKSRALDLNYAWDQLTPEEQKEREKAWSKYNDRPTQTKTNTRKQKESQFA